MLTNSILKPIDISLLRKTRRCKRKTLLFRVAKKNGAVVSPVFLLSRFAFRQYQLYLLDPVSAHLRCLKDRTVL